VKLNYKIYNAVKSV